MVDSSLRPERSSTVHNELADEPPVDTAFASSKALEGLSNVDILSEIEGILETMSGERETPGEHFGKTVAEAGHAIKEMKSRWRVRKSAIQDICEELLREIQKSTFDVVEYIRLRQQIEDLRPLNDKMERNRRDLEAHEPDRRNLLAEWEDIKAPACRQVKTATMRVSRKLRDRVQVRVTMAGNRDPLRKLLREEIGGNLAQALECLRARGQLSLPELAQRCRDGKDAVRTYYDLPSGAAERIAQAEQNLFMRIEELELLLLLEAEASLVVDQPEDDLDNRFITDSVVPIMRRKESTAASSSSRRTTPISQSSAMRNSSSVSLQRARHGKVRRVSLRSTWPLSTQDLYVNSSRKS